MNDTSNTPEDAAPAPAAPATPAFQRDPGMRAAYLPDPPRFELHEPFYDGVALARQVPGAGVVAVRGEFDPSDVRFEEGHPRSEGEIFAVLAANPHAEETGEAVALGCYPETDHRNAFWMHAEQRLGWYVRGAVEEPQTAAGLRDAILAGAAKVAAEIDAAIADGYDIARWHNPHELTAFFTRWDVRDA